MSSVAVTFSHISLSWTNMEAVNKQDIVSVHPSGYRMNKSTHPVDLNVCDLTPLSLPPLLPSERTGHNGSVDTHTHQLAVCVVLWMEGGLAVFEFHPCWVYAWRFFCGQDIQSPDLDPGCVGTHVVLNNPGPPPHPKYTHTHTLKPGSGSPPWLSHALTLFNPYDKS